MTKKRRFFTTFFTKLIIFLGPRWNISTSETVLERLLNLWIFGTYITKILHPVRAKEPPKVKKFKIGVARKLDLIEPNWVYSFSSFIRPYQTHIVRSILFSISFNLLDRVSSWIWQLQFDLFSLQIRVSERSRESSFLLHGSTKLKFFWRTRNTLFFPKSTTIIKRSFLSLISVWYGGNVF